MPLTTAAGDRLAPQKAESGHWVAIETAGLYGTVAAAEVTHESCEIVVAESLPRDARSAQTLAPALKSLLERLRGESRRFTTVAVAVGPGSFTGLRVGVATAKVLAYASEAAMIGVDTLDATVEVAPPPKEPAEGLWAVLDAQRGELFASRFVERGGHWKREGPTQRLARQTLADYAGQADLVVGPAATTLLRARGCRAIDVEPTAASVLRVAWREWKAGKADNVFALSPKYFRPSAAEEKLATEPADS